MAVRRSHGCAAPGPKMSKTTPCTVASWLPAGCLRFFRNRLTRRANHLHNSTIPKSRHVSESGTSVGSPEPHDLSGRRPAARHVAPGFDPALRRLAQHRRVQRIPHNLSSRLRSVSLREKGRRVDRLSGKRKQNIAVAFCAGAIERLPRVGLFRYVAFIGILSRRPRRIALRRQT